MHHFTNDRFLPCFWMKCHLTLTDYGASLGIAQKGFICKITLQPRRASSLKLQLSSCMGDAMFFICYSPYQRQLTYNIMLYESWLHGVFHIYSTYTTLKPRSSEVCSAYALQTSLTSILRLCIRRIHHITMIHIIYDSNISFKQSIQCRNNHCMSTLSSPLTAPPTPSLDTACRPQWPHQCLQLALPVPHPWCCGPT